MNDYPGSMALGEIGDAQLGMELIGQYTSGDDLMHMCYAFDFLSRERPDASRIAEIIDGLGQTAPDAWACWAFSNHDVERHISRWNLSQRAARTMLTVLLSLRGSVCLYQGEELGLPEAELDYDDLRDPYGIRFWPEFKGRDGCRTPMVWDENEVNSGFSRFKPWLPQPASHRQLKALNADADVLSFWRQTTGQSVFCAFNLSDVSQSVNIPEGRWRPLTEGGDGVHGTELPVGGQTVLEPWQSLLAEALD